MFLRLEWDKRSEVERSQDGRRVVFAVPVEGDVTNEKMLAAVAGQITTANVESIRRLGPSMSLVLVTTKGAAR